MKTTALITEKAQDSPMVLPGKESLETAARLNLGANLVANTSLITDLDERMNRPLKFRPIGFSREFGLNE
jgi:hypothetical protein